MEETILLETNEKVNLKWDRTGKRIMKTLQLLCWNFSVVCQVEWVAYFPPWQCFLQRLRSSLKSCRFHSWEHQRERINSRPLQKLSCPQLLSVACCPLLTSVMPRYHLLPSVASYYPLLPPVVLLLSAALWCRMDGLNGNRCWCMWWAHILFSCNMTTSPERTGEALIFTQELSVRFRKAL